MQKEKELTEQKENEQEDSKQKTDSKSDPAKGEVLKIDEHQKIMDAYRKKIEKPGQIFKTKGTPCECLWYY